MLPIAGPASLHPGDVLHHPAFGFAVAERVDPVGVDLRWERPGPNHPTHVAAAGLVDAYKRCDPRGLFARSVEGLEATRVLVSREPLLVLVLLLLDLGEKQRVQDIRDWLGERRLVGDQRFDSWWGAVLPLLPADPRLVLRRQHLALADGITFESLPASVAAPLAPAGGLLPGSLPAYALRMARALAELHARGMVLLDERDAIGLAGGGFELRGRPRTSGEEPRADLRRVARVLLEQVLGQLPAPRDLAEDELPALIGSLEPGISFDLLAALGEALSDDPTSPLTDGGAFLERVSAALAAHELRHGFPHDPAAGVVVGFDTHIGLAKSLDRQTNQDAYLLVGDPELALVGVADGISLSSAGSGDLASFLLVRTLRTWWAEVQSALPSLAPARVHALLQEGLRRANKVVCEQAHKLAGGDLHAHIPMGTTVVLAVVVGNRVHLACAGDSRAWVVGRYGVALASADMNLSALRLRDALRGGVPEWGEGGHALTSYIGHFTQEGRVELPPVFTRTFTLLPGEWLVMATDGLSDFAAETELGVVEVLRRAVASASPTTTGAMQLARELVGAANEGGGGDNVTVLVLTNSSEPLPDERTDTVPS